MSLPSLSPSASPNFYGLKLYYKNHIDGSDATPVSPDTNPSLPGGDLGIWISTEESTGEACVSAKMNQLIADLSAKEDSALLLAASMVCLANVSGKSLPSAGGAAVDLTTELNSAVQLSSSSTSITAASLSRLSDQDSHPVYQFSISATQASLALDIHLKHMPTNSDNSLYRGSLSVSLLGMNSGDERQKNAYLVLGYERTSDDIRMQLEHAGTRDSIADAITEAGAIDWAKVQASGGVNSANLQHALFKIDPSTGLGSVSYSWQAGGADGASRVFNAYTAADGGSVSGCGFFGFGDGYTTAGAADNSIGKFICNWAGPGNSHVGVADKAQKQCMTQDSSGLFVPNPLKENITYAPSNSCDGGEVGSGFKAGTADNDGSMVALDSVSNNLVTISSDLDYIAYVAPVAPSIPE